MKLLSLVFEGKLYVKTKLKKDIKIKEFIKFEKQN